MQSSIPILPASARKRKFMLHIARDGPALDDLPQTDLAEIERQTQAIGRHLLANSGDTKPHVWQRRWWDDKILAWSMRDEALKVQLFRFVDVLPMLHSAEQVTEHLHEYLEDVRDRLPAPLRTALGV